MARIHWIGGDKGGVGRTLTACLLAQHWIDRGQEWLGFDAGESAGAFARRYAPRVRVLGTTDDEGFDAVVDALEATASRLVVDLPAGQDRRLRGWMEAARVPGLLAREGHASTHWHVLDNSKDALRGLYAALDRTPPGEALAVVLNHGRSRHFMLFEDSALRDEIAARGGAVVALPRLEAGAMSAIDAHDKSFWAAVHNTDRSLGPCLTPMQRQRTQVFLDTSFAALEPVLGESIERAPGEAATAQDAEAPLSA